MKIKRKNTVMTLIAALCLTCLAGCGSNNRNTDNPSEISSQSDSQSQIDVNSLSGSQNQIDVNSLSGSQNQTDTDSLPDSQNKEEPPHSLIDPAGMTVQTRILPPEGYSRTSSKSGSLTEFLRDYPLKEDQSPVLLYNGKKKRNQTAHQAILAMQIENVDLQQCADSVIRIYAEYYYRTGQPEKIAFHFTSGFLAEYSRWRDGERILVDGNQVQWVSGGVYDDSYETFVQYLQTVFCYAGTLSMTTECEEIRPDKADVGDVFLKGGSPGHVVMIIDVCENETGGRAFLLAQGYMPAQEFHILKNPLHEEDCWYYEEEITYPLHTPEYVFDEHSLCRPKY